MNSSYRFILDLHSTQSQISLPVTKGDTARVWYISLSDGGVPYTIPDGILAKLSVKRQTGSTLEAFCAIERNTTVKYDFSEDEITAQTAAVEGIHDCSITLYDAEGRILGTPRFTMVVSDRVLNRDDVVLTDEDITAVDAMLVKEAARQVAEDERASAEGERASAEEARESAETERENAESLRVEAENKRNNAESGRVEAENERVAVEEKREERFNKVIGLLSQGNTRIDEVTLLASAWAGADDPYSQVVEIIGVTEYTKVDLLPSVEQLAIFHDKDLEFVTENEDGVVTVYCIGDKPTGDYTIQVALTEVIA